MGCRLIRPPNLPAELPQADGPKTYSKAFDNLVSGDDDIVGLLAYALFKQGVREQAERGLSRSPGETRDPSPTIVRAYRESAEKRIAEIVTDSIDRATPEIQRSATLDAVITAEANIKTHVSSRTGFWPAILTNVLAWAFTLVITILILSLVNLPDLARSIANNLSNGPAETTLQPLKNSN